MAILNKILLGFQTPAIQRNFEEGGFQTAYIVNDSPLTIRINPYLDCYYYSQYLTQWYALRLRYYGGKTPIFLIDKSVFWTSYTAGMWTAGWATALDTDTWYQFDNLSVGANDITFSMNTPFPSSDIYIALNPLYPLSRTTRKVGEWAVSSLVGETASSTNNILSLSSAVALDGMRKSPLNLPYYAFRITNTTDNSKNNGILSTGQHACEPTGRFAFEGAINWLITTSPQQKALLDWFNFLCYPDLYPINVWAGHSRDIWTDYSKDVNGEWGTANVYEHKTVYEAAFTADTGGAAAISFDFHSYAESANATMGDTENAAYFPMTAFKTEMVKLDSSYTLFQETLPDSLPHYLQTTLGVVLPMTQEQKLGTARGVSDWKAYGSNSLTALGALTASGIFTYAPFAGARSFNGTTDRIDWTNIYTPASTNPFTVSMWVFPIRVNTDQMLFVINDSTNTFGQMYFWNPGNIAGSGCLTFAYNSSANTLFRTTSTGSPGLVAGIWQHILATWSGTFTDATTIHIYFNGTETGGYIAAQNGSGTPRVGSHDWSIGAWEETDGYSYQGKIAQVGVWDRVLTSTEISALSADASPSSIPTNLRFWFPGNTSDLHDKVTNTLGVADGTTSITGVTHGPEIGARTFNGTTDRIDWTNIYTPASTNPFTVSMWVYPTRINTNQMLFIINDSTGVNGQLYLWNPGSGTTGLLTFAYNSSADALYRTANNNSPGLVTGIWQHILATWNGTFTDATTIHIYFNGTETGGYIAAQNGSGTPRVGSHDWSIGAWEETDGYSYQGKIAQVGVWDSVLSPTNITNLAAGYAPSLIGTPRFYFRGDTSDLHDQITNTNGTGDGTTQVNGVATGPTIYYP